MVTPINAEEKIVENGGLPDDSSLNGTTRYYYHGWRVVEEYRCAICG